MTVRSAASGSVSVSIEPQLPDSISESLALTQSRLTALGEREFVNKSLSEPATHLLKHPGKLVRPGILLSTAHILGEEPSKFVDLAAGIELLHTSSLVHDDIIDRDTTRRGSEAVHSKYGINSAILAGDALIAEAIHLASRYGGVVVQRASEAAMSMCAGEILDHEQQTSKAGMDLETYLKIARLKTASLIATSFSVVADYTGSGARDRLYNIGVNVGMSFQIKDDIMNFLGVKDKAAKSVRTDAKNNRPNIVSVFEFHGKRDPLRTAAKLNNFYLDQAAAELDELENSTLLSSYIEYLRISP